tara:strand:- start:1431 stop:2405 length:975 start_codon:yes stop_codon:yes gene_type:complete
MIVFENPIYFFALLLIPLKYLIVQKYTSKNTASITIPSINLVSKDLINSGKKTYFIFSLINYLIILLLILALARPRVIDSLVEKNIEIVDIVLVLDISSSMLATDFPPNRLEATKKTAKSFISNRKQDRIGILVFAGETFIQCPLTIDKSILIDLMDDIAIAEQSYDGTAIGMAIANGTNRLRKSDSKSKVMILLSDGSNNAGELDPLTAADLASKFGIKIYTIGAGTNQDVSFIPGRGYIRNEIDEETLKLIAKKTNGKYFRATDMEGLEQIYQTIDQLEKTEVKISQFTSYKDLFGFLLISAVLISMIAQFFEKIIIRRKFW